MVQPTRILNRPLTVKHSDALDVNINLVNTQHNVLPGLQGGDAGGSEYYHLDYEKYSEIVAGTSSFDYVDFNTAIIAPSGVPGRLFWDTGHNTLGLYTPEGTILQIGQEFYHRVYNGTGSTLTDGTVVFAVGSYGDLVQVAPAKADSYLTSLTTLGIVTHDILAGEEGFVTFAGHIHDVDTSLSFYTLR